MPYTVIPKFPIVMEKIKASGHTKEISRNDLEVFLMEITGATTEKTLSRYMYCMHKLGYIKPRNAYVFEILNHDSKIQEIEI
jgi:hypothetical protein